LGAFLALVAVAVLRRSPKPDYYFSWLLFLETVADIIIGIVQKAYKPLWGNARVVAGKTPFVCNPLLNQG
jgi:hypothetical protein